MKAYSQDLRDRVIKAHTVDNMTPSAISRVFDVCLKTVYNWLYRFKTTGDYSSKQEMQSRLFYRCLHFMIPWRDLKSHIKKETKYKERREAQREKFNTQISQTTPGDLVFIDQLGVDDNIVLQYGWSEKGQHSYAEQPSVRKQRLSIVAGYEYGSKAIIAPFEYEGYTDSHLFNEWFEKHLVPALRPGQVVILDNAAYWKQHWKMALKSFFYLLILLI